MSRLRRRRCRFRAPPVRKSVREERGDDGFQAGQSFQERREGGLPGPAPSRARLGVAQGQEALGPGDADEEQPPLLLEVAAGLARLRAWGMMPSSTPTIMTAANSRPLALCRVISDTAPDALVVGVHVADEGDLLEIGGQPARGGLGPWSNWTAERMSSSTFSAASVSSSSSKGLPEAGAVVDVADDLRPPAGRAATSSPRSCRTNSPIRGTAAGGTFGDLGRVPQDDPEVPPGRPGRGRRACGRSCRRCRGPAG